MQYLGIGCTGCGSLLALMGLVVLGVTYKFVQASEQVVGYWVGGGSCVLSLFALIAGAVVIAIARRQAAAGE